MSSSVSKHSIFTVVEPSKEGDFKLRKAKIDLIQNFPFLGYLVITTNYAFSNDLDTCAATTIPENTVFVNEDFFLNKLISNEERSFVIAHELLHIFLEHLGRQQKFGYNPKLWNIAADFCINNYLHEISKDSPGSMSMPKIALYDSQFENKSADQIYKILAELLDEMQQDMSEMSQSEMEDTITEQYGNGGQQALDEISKETVSEQTNAENKAKMAAAVQHASEMRRPGEGASSLERLFDSLIKPRVNWKELIREEICNTNTEYLSYARYSRRSTPTIIFPVNDGSHVDLLFGVDSSGSMSSSDLSEAISEFAGLLNSFTSWNVELVSCDTKVSTVAHFNSEEHSEDDVAGLSLTGGGGTDMLPIVEYALERETEALFKTCVIFTDGWLEDTFSHLVEQDNDLKLIVMITSRGCSDFKCDNPNVIIIKMDDV